MSFNTYCKFDKDNKIHHIFSVINEVVFCLNKDGQWVIFTYEGLSEIDKFSYNMALLTLLEMPVNDLLERIEVALSNYQDFEVPLQDFPINAVIYSGLKSESAYWVDLALNWISGMDVEKLSNKLMLKTILESIEKTKRYPQDIRHRCRKLKKIITV